MVVDAALLVVLLELLLELLPELPITPKTTKIIMAINHQRL